MNPIRVVIADDHQIVRNGVRSVIQTVSHIQVVGEAANGKDAIQRVAEFQPDVILMDIAMPGMDGIEATRQIHSRYPRTRILILSNHKDLALVSASITAGADGYLLKEGPSEEILVAIEAVSHGMFIMDQGLRDVVKNVVANRVQDSDIPSRELFPELSDTLYNTLILHLKGMTNDEIAEQRSRSPKAIWHHIPRIYELINVRRLSEDPINMRDLVALRREVEARAKRKHP